MIIEYSSSIINIPEGLYFFYASWNSNCNLIMDTLNEINKMYPLLNIFKINTTKYPNIKKQYNIGKIPSYIMNYKNKLYKLDGYKNSYSLKKWIANILKE